MAQVPLVFPLNVPMTYWQLSRNLIDFSATIRWCQSLKLLPSSKTCTCGRGMHVVRRKGKSRRDGMEMPSERVQKGLSTLQGGTFFEGNTLKTHWKDSLWWLLFYNVPTSQLRQPLDHPGDCKDYLWSVKTTPVGKAQDELQVSITLL